MIANPKKNIFLSFPTIYTFVTLITVPSYLQQEPNIQTSIVRRAGQGDGDAQALLYQQYSKAMYNICIRMTGTRNDAEDLLHDAFLKAFKKLDQLKQPEAFGGWLRQIVVNECIRHSRFHVNWNNWEDHHEETLADEATEWWTTVSLDLVHREIKELPEGCRQVFVLFVLEDYSHRQIAENLGISEGTSKSQYHRARTMLKDRINKKMAVNG